MRRALLVALLAFGLAAGGAGSAHGEGWRSEQPVAAGIGVRVPLGEVGDIEFQAPNRGVLITAGNEGMPAGVYAYDGTGWHLYSTVCGGHQGRIAWAGPDEFWTISDQQVGQESAEPTRPEAKYRISLCHFKNGAVVASFGEPLGQATSYLAMNAVACSGPGDCWFAGERLPGTRNVGAFHLHWDGATMTAIPSLAGEEPELGDPGRAIGGLAFWGGSLLESVEVRPGDEAPGETPDQPTLLHRIVPGGASPFIPVTGGPFSFGGSGATAEQLEAIHLAAAGGSLWAVAGALAPPARATFLRLDSGGLNQIALTDPATVFAAGEGIQGIAPEPETESAWISLGHGSPPITSPARIVRVHADGAVDAPLQLPDPGEGIGNKGEAGPVSCPAPGQCWMATSRGWLFHLGPDLAQDTDPAMHTLISSRPADNSVPSPPPFELPADDSGAEPEKEEPAPLVEPFPTSPKPKKLVVGLKQRVLHGTVLVLSFTLRAKAHVRLVASRKGKTVARTPRLTLGKGPHQLRLKLNPELWPTHLSFQVHSVGKQKAGK